MCVVYTRMIYTQKTNKTVFVIRIFMTQFAEYACMYVILFYTLCISMYLTNSNANKYYFAHNYINK